jgi:hypothetical protein
MRVFIGTPPELKSGIIMSLQQRVLVWRQYAMAAPSGGGVIVSPYCWIEQANGCKICMSVLSGMFADAGSGDAEDPVWSAKQQPSPPLRSASYDR